MKKIVIIGNSSYAKMMKEYLTMDNKGKICAYAVDEIYVKEKEIDGIPVISFEKLKADYHVDDFDLIMGIGYTQMGNVRKRIFELCKSWGYHFENYIHPTAIIAPNVQIGEGNNILEGVILESGVTIKDANLIYGGVLIGHDTNILSYNTFAGKTSIAGYVTIKSNCFFGVSSAIKDYVTIEDYVLIGAMGYGYKDMKEYSVVMPAKSTVLTDKISTDYL